MLEVSGVVARLGFTVDDTGAHKFQRELAKTRSEARHDTVAHLDAKPDLRGFDVYQRKLKEAGERARRKGVYQAKLGADFDPRAFNAAERELNRYQRTSRATTRAEDEHIRALGRMRTAFGSVYGRG